MFSVIMPVWNRAEVVPKAIRSVLAQTCRDFELLIVDDGSEDGLHEAIAPLLSEQVRYYRTPHAGVGAARNHGLRHARREYIAYLDSDNVWKPDYLERMRQALAREPAARAAYSRIDVVWIDHATGREHITEGVGEAFSLCRLLQNNYIDLNAFVHAKECLCHCGSHDEGLKRLVDWDFILRVALKYAPVFVDAALVKYYKNAAAHRITTSEGFAEHKNRIVRRNPMPSRVVRIVHDAIAYTWADVDEAKFDNFMRVGNSAPNTKDYTAWGLPYMLQIEPTSLCNLSCPLCPTGRGELNRPSRHLQLEEFTAIIDDLERSLLFLVLWNWGEPLLNPALPDMVRHAARRGIKTVTSTNGHFFRDEEYLSALFEAGLTTLIVSIDSVSDDNYGVYRKRGELQRVLDGLHRAVAVKRKTGARTAINVRMVVMKQNEHEVDAVERMARQAGADFFTAKTLNPSCGDVVLDSELLPVNERYRRYEYVPGTFERVCTDPLCRVVWTMPSVLSNGDVAPCCYDYDAEMRVGNVFEKPLSEFWNGPEYRALRKLVHDTPEASAKCRRCDVNFKLSENGWFIRAVDLNREARQSGLLPYVVHLDSEADGIARLAARVKELQQRLDEIQSSLSWKLANRMRGLFAGILPDRLYERLKHSLGMGPD